MAAEAERAARAGVSQRSRRTPGRDHQGPLQRRSAAERTPVHPHRDSTGCRLPDAAFPTFVSQPRPALQPWPRLPSASALDRRSPRQKFTSSPLAGRHSQVWTGPAMQSQRALAASVAERVCSVSRIVELSDVVVPDPCSSPDC